MNDLANSRCLYCYQQLVSSSAQEQEARFHTQCSRAFFGVDIPPTLEYTIDDMFRLAEDIIRQQVAVTGVQAKLLLTIERQKKDDAGRFTLVGLWGDYILKPPTADYEALPEVEDLTMHLAQLSGITTVPHILIPLASGELAYLTKRVDRTKNGKLPMEDMCQLTERLTEHKYHGSHEQIAKAIARFSQNKGLNIINFYEVVLFSFLTGNADMHLKNFSLLTNTSGATDLAPAYDLVATKLLLPEDEEDLALTLDERKKKLTRKNFVSAMERSGLRESTIENVFARFERTMDKWPSMIRNSFVSTALQDAYLELISDRCNQLGLKVPTID